MCWLVTPDIPAFSRDHLPHSPGNLRNVRDVSGLGLTSGLNALTFVSSLSVPEQNYPSNTTLSCLQNLLEIHRIHSSYLLYPRKWMRLPSSSLDLSCLKEEMALSCNSRGLDWLLTKNFLTKLDQVSKDEDQVQGTGWAIIPVGI